MKGRFTDTAWTEGDFNKATTSPSQTALQNSIWFIKYHLSPHLNFKPERPSISFEAGKFIHEWFRFNNCKAKYYGYSLFYVSHHQGTPVKQFKV